MASNMSLMQDKEYLLRGIVWDYNINPIDLYFISMGEKSPIGGFDKGKAFLRIVERLSWYDLLQLYDIQFIKENLTKELIKKIRNETLRNRYEILYQLLRGKLYPLQDGILKIVKDLKLPFYLTGGTALSRFYFNQLSLDAIELFSNRKTELFHLNLCR